MTTDTLNGRLTYALRVLIAAQFICVMVTLFVPSLREHVGWPSVPLAIQVATLVTLVMKIASKAPKRHTFVKVLDAAAIVAWILLAFLFDSLYSGALDAMAGPVM